MSPTSEYGLSSSSGGGGGGRDISLEFCTPPFDIGAGGGPGAGGGAMPGFRTESGVSFFRVLVGSARWEFPLLLFSSSPELSSFAIEVVPEDAFSWALFSLSIAANSSPNARSLNFSFVVKTFLGLLTLLECGLFCCGETTHRAGIHEFKKKNYFSTS